VMVINALRQDRYTVPNVDTTTSSTSSIDYNE